MLQEPEGAPQPQPPVSPSDVLLSLRRLFTACSALAVALGRYVFSSCTWAAMLLPRTLFHAAIGASGGVLGQLLAPALTRLAPLADAATQTEPLPMPSPASEEDILGPMLASVVAERAAATAEAQRLRAELDAAEAQLQLVREYYEAALDESATLRALLGEARAFMSPPPPPLPQQQQAEGADAAGRAKGRAALEERLQAALQATPSGAAGGGPAAAADGAGPTGGGGGSGGSSSVTPRGVSPAPSRGSLLLSPASARAGAGDGRAPGPAAPPATANGTGGEGDRDLLPSRLFSSSPRA